MSNNDERKIMKKINNNPKKNNDENQKKKIGRITGVKNGNPVNYHHQVHQKYLK